MADDQVLSLDPAILQRTQETLGQVIKKPPLTEKLLKKPPFKFLHDIITSVISTTGFMRDIFTEDELNSENVKDRDSKIAFLQKAIDHVVASIGEPLKIRPGKTVAGHEAERTNEFLQALARAVIKEREPTEQNNLPAKQKSPTKSPVKKAEKGAKNVVTKPDVKERRHRTVEASQTTSSRRTAVSEKSKPEKSKSDKSKPEKSASHDKTPREKTKDKERALRTTKDKDNSNENKEASVQQKTRSKSRDRPTEKTLSKSKVVGSTSGTAIEDGKVAARSERRKTSLNNADSALKDSSRRPSVVKSKGDDIKKKLSTVTKSPEKVREKKVENDDFADEAIASSTEIKEHIIRELQVVEPEVVVGGVGTELVNGYSTKADEKTSQQMKLSGRPPTGRPVTTRSASNDVDTQGEMGALRPTSSSYNGVQNTPAVEEAEEEPVKRPSTSTIRRSSARPPTARPAAPRVRVVEMAPEDAIVQQSTNQVSNIILDGDASKEDDDDETFVVEEPPVLIDNSQVANSISADELAGKPHGSLVTQILETKKDLETGSERPTTSLRKVEIDTHLVLDVARRKERETVAREMDRLREGVQALSRSANPLGKLIGYLEEDVESMIRELSTWTLESDQLEVELRRKQSESDSDLDQLNQQMKEVEEAIDEKLAKICTVKANILRNDEKIRKMVSAVKV